MEVGECEVPVAVDEFALLTLNVLKFAPAASKSKDSKGSNPSSSGKAQLQHSLGAD